MDPVRLARYLAHAGVASRRAAERLVSEGRVTVGGRPATDPALDVDERSGVAVDGDPVAPEPTVVYALNKPRGALSTARDTHGRPTVTALVPSDRRLYPVGRLDADTTGLLLMTNDGELANLLRRLREGVELDDGMTSPGAVRQTRPGVLELTLREGRKRQVRRMCEAVGHRVVELERVAIGPLRLGALEAGANRRLTAAEVERLRAAARPSD